MSTKKYLALDVGERRIGVAIGDMQLALAWPYGVVLADDKLAETLGYIVKDQSITDVVVGKPRNQGGQTTDQTTKVQDFVNRFIAPLNLTVHWQDESVTSVIAEQRLKLRQKTYTKEDIDAEAAAIILQDFLETIKK